jgi:Aerotolerance regulator N-terminal
MISFLNSGILFLTSAIVIPVLIYLFARKRPKKIIFSSIRFIKESQQQQKKRINIKNLLLLLIRILIILSVILAISRPALRLPFLEKGDLHPKTAVAIIIDNSYSMNYLVDTQTELEKAKSIALQINEMLSDDDEVILLTLDNDWNQINGNIRFGKLDPDLIANISITAQKRELLEILEEAEQKNKETHLPNREIIVISDLQNAELPEKNIIPTYFVSTSNITDRHNISVQNSSIYNEIVQKGKATKLSFELINHSNTEQQDNIYRLFLDGNTISEKATDLQAGQQKSASFEVDVHTSGWHSGYVEVKNERQTFDNRNYFSFYYDPDPKIAFISDTAEIPIVLSSLLEIYAGKSGNINFMEDSQLSVENLEEFDNIIIYKKSYSSKLNFILENIDSYLLIADKDFSVDWQEYLGKEFQLSLTEFKHSTNPLLLNYYNKYHPITRHMKNVSDVEINDYWATGANSSAILKAESNSIALEKDNKCVWLFDVNSLQNHFLLDAAFPVFAYNTLVYLADTGALADLKIGDKIKSQQITLPDGQTIQINNARYFANKAGIYETPERKIAVNLNYSESSFSKMNDPKKKNVIFTNAEWQQQILHSRYGFELWKYLLVFALILFALEIFIVKREENK